MPIEIAPVHPAHVKSLHRTFGAIASEGRFFVSPSAPGIRELKRDVRAAIRRRFPFYVALDGEIAIGWVRIAFPSIEALAHSGTLTMGLLSAHRRQGIGGRLLEAAVAHAFRDPERHRIQLEVLDDNTAAIALYSKHGFRIEGTAEKAVRIRGELRNIFHMARLTINRS